VVENHVGGTRMGIGVPISKVVPAKPTGRKATQQRRKAARRGSGAWYLRATEQGRKHRCGNAVEPLRKRSGAEGGAKRQPRSDTELSEQCGNAERRGTREHRGNAERGAETTRRGNAERRGKRGAAGSRTLRLCTMEGRSLDNPTRGNPALRPGRKDRNASGKPASRSGGSRKSERK